VQVVRRKEVASSDLRFEEDDIGLWPLRGDEEWVEACVGKQQRLQRLNQPVNPARNACATQ
jgi:hypothetical protein